MRKNVKWLLCVLGLVVATGVCADPPVGRAIEAITAPSEDSMLSFSRPGRIQEILVKDGDVVKEGDVLVRMDDEAEQVRLERLRIQAEDTTSIRAGEASLKQKQVDLQRIEWASKEGAATELEVEHARLEVTIRDLSLELAKVQQAQYKREYEETKVLVGQMRIRSPFDGVVARIAAGVGESVDAGKDVLRVVKIDPLWIEAPVPEDQAERLAAGQKAQVKYDDRDEMIVGKVVFKSPVIEPGSRTLTIRIELPNGEKRAAGKHVTVSFPPEQQKAPVAAMDSGQKTGQGSGGQAETPQDKER